jgi:carbonic anhydrase
MTANLKNVDKFKDLIEANRAFADNFSLSGFDGIARAGVALVTCMDSRIDPLGMLGLEPGDAKIIRNPGGRIDASAIEGLILAVHLLNVDRIIVAPHTKCAMGSKTEEEFRTLVANAAGMDANWQHFGAVADQMASLKDDVRTLRSHPLIPDSVEIAGFVYNVDTGLLEPTV